jgi:hypothetical protein
MDKAPPYLMFFANNLVVFQPDSSPSTISAYGYILLSVYTGIPTHLLLGHSKASPSHIWVNLRTQRGEKVVLGVEIPRELLNLLESKKIATTTFSRVPTSTHNLLTIMKLLNSAQENPVSLEELPCIFKLMCTHSADLKLPMTKRLRMLESDLDTTMIGIPTVNEPLSRVSLLRLLGLKPSNAAPVSATPRLSK